MSVTILNAKDSVGDVSSGAPDVSDTLQPFAGLETTAQAALTYISNGLVPLPLPPNSKKPKMKGWPSFMCKKEDVPKHFGGQSNIAILLGEPSGGCVDVDLDVAEAVALAAKCLPQTDCVFGRQSRPASHYVYLSDSPIKTRKWQLHLKGDDAVLLELRSTKSTTVFPPSAHPSGEVVEFELGKAGLPTKVSGEALVRGMNLLAAATAMAIVWPKKKGVRQDLAMALSGGLLRVGMPPDDVVTFVTWVAEAAGDDEVEQRRGAADQTIKKHASERAVTGWPRVVGCLGPDGQQVVDQVRGWLGQVYQVEPEGKLDAVLASEVTVRAVEWFWPRRIAYGAITIIDGDPGQGKSTICMDLAARHSAGRPLPGGGECEPAGVVVLTAEDSHATTVVPRLIAAGAKLDSIKLVRGMKDSHGTTGLVSIPDDLGVLREAIESIGARLMVIEPLMAFISLTTNSHNDQQMRRALAPLSALAEETGVAVLTVRHLTKKPGGRALYRGGGSIGLIGAARAGMIVGTDPYDDSCRVLAMTKTNLCELAPSLRYRVVPKCSPPDTSPPWEVSAIKWMGQTDVHADQLVQVSGKEKGVAVKEAMTFLEAVLKDGPMKVKEVMALAKEDGHSKPTLRRASRKLGVLKTPIHDGQKIVEWQWNLPQQAGAGDLVDDDVPSGSSQPVEPQHVH